MTDIVEQLRSLKGLYAMPPAPFTSKDVLTLMHEAAAEIERLHHNEAFHVERAAAQDAEIERLRGLLANSEMTVAEVMAANERIRAALREVVAEYSSGMSGGMTRMRDIARAALEGK